MSYLNLVPESRAVTYGSRFVLFCFFKKKSISDFARFARNLSILY
eukprot:SAG31_NODE_13530_length_863_cov_1.497382_2_plen_44_part_01